MLLLATAFIFILVIIMALLIRRNIQRVVKKKYGRLINAKVIKWCVISGQPTRYLLEVEYQMNSIKKTKRFITSGKFARKYEKEKDIPIVVMQDTDQIFFEEEDWKEQNICLLFIIIITLPVLILLLFCSFLEIMKVLCFLTT